MKIITEKFKKDFKRGLITGFVIGSLGALLGILGMSFYYKKMNERIVEKINSECPILSGERKIDSLVHKKLDSLVHNPKTKDLFLHYSLINELDTNNLQELFLFSIDTTLYSLMTEKEKKIFLRENNLKFILYSNEGKILSESLQKTE